MGHEQPINNMGDHYDYLDIETNLERQAEKLPHGPLGMFVQPSVEVMRDIPGELISALIDYREKSGERLSSCGSVGYMAYERETARTTRRAAGHL